MTLNAPCPDSMLQHVFDAMPSMIFVVDGDMRVQTYNAAAAELLAATDGAVFKGRCGEVLGCLNAKGSPRGCGHGHACSGCVVRNAVAKVFAGGRVVRQRSRLELTLEGRTIDLFAQVTASPFLFDGQELALLVIEDFSEIMALKRMIPICSVCKKIRDGASSWSRLEAYFKEQWGVDFSHGYCPECYRDAVGELDAALPKSDRSNNRVA